MDSIKKAFHGDERLFSSFDFSLFYWRSLFFFDCDEGWWLLSYTNSIDTVTIRARITETIRVSATLVFIRVEIFFITRGFKRV